MPSSETEHSSHDDFFVSMTGKGRRLLSGRRDGEVEASGKQECVRGNVRFHADVDVTEGRRRELYK